MVLVPKELLVWNPVEAVDLAENKLDEAEEEILTPKGFFTESADGCPPRL